MKLRIFFLLATLVTLNACTIQKRKHLGGLYIEWLSIKNEKTNIKKSNTEIDSLSQLKILNNSYFEADLSRNIRVVNEKNNYIKSNQKLIKKNIDYKNEIQSNQTKQKSLSFSVEKGLSHNINDRRKANEQKNWAMLALIFGVCSIVIFPLFGILGLHFAGKVTDPEHKGVAKVGQILSIIGLVILILAFIFLILFLLLLIALFSQS